MYEDFKLAHRGSVAEIVSCDYSIVEDLSFDTRWISKSMDFYAILYNTARTRRTRVNYNYPVGFVLQKITVADIVSPFEAEYQK